MSSSTPELDSALQRFARQAQSLTLAGGAAIALASPEAPDGADFGDEMTFRASTGEDAPDVGARLRISRGFAGECVREGKALRCDDSETDSRVDRDRCRKLGIRSVVTVPLKNNQSVLGIIEIFSPRTKAFTESHMAKLRVLAERVTSAVEDANNPAAPIPVAPVPELIWADVFVDASLPWKRLLQSAACHLVVVAAVWNITLNWAKSEKILRPPVAPPSQLTYYPNHPSFPTALSRPPAPAVAKVEKQSDKPAAMVVKTASQRQTIAPPNVKVPAHGGPSLAAGNPVLPAMARPPALSAVTSPQRMNLASGGGPGMGRTSIVAPAPQIGEAFRRQGVAAPGASVIAPSPSIDGPVRMAASVNVGHSTIVGPPPGMPLHDGPVGSGISMGGTDVVVGPPPGIPSHARSSILSAGLGGSGTVVGPPPGMPSHEGPVGSGMTIGGSGAVIGPPPTMPSREGSGMSGILSAGLGGSGTIVGPPPGMPSHEASGVSGASGASGITMGGSGTVIGPPPGMPSREGSGGSLSAGLGGSGTVAGPPPGMPSGPLSTPSSALGGLGTSAVSPPAGPGSGTSGSGTSGSGPVGSPSGSGSAAIAEAGGLAGGTRQGDMNIRSSIPPPPPSRIDDPAGRIIPELPVRVLGLALTLPSSSFFSNYEVFIAERQIAKSESQLIKLVYESRPTQRRLSEYGVKDSKIVKLKVKRDPTCDETASQIAGNHLSELQNSSTEGSLRSTDGDSLLPCYRTTADDYQKTLSRAH